ncbi:MAG: NUDIX hydrolase [Planctomycetes bacterium]|nr:NUDIX hydrolase [Planctomycetota bacterium]
MERRGTSRKRDEAAFLAEYDASRYPRPSLTVDVALIQVEQGRIRSLVRKRGGHPELGKWGLPGGFVRPDESLDEAAARVLREKTGWMRVFLEQLYTFGRVDRDPRTRVVTVAYYALVDAGRLIKAEDSAMQTEWAELVVPWDGERGGTVDCRSADGHRLPLAFDHAEILGMAVRRLRGKLPYAPIGFELLPRRFTLRALQDIHEAILGHTVNKDAFRRRLLASGLISATGVRETGVGHRPAELYRFARGDRETKS